MYRAQITNLTHESSGASSFRHCPLPYNSVSKRGKILAYEDLRDWIAALERAGELKTIRTEVDPVLEIAEITDRVSKNAGAGASPVRPGGPALLFKNIKGHPGAQVLINQFGSARRMNLALEVDSLDQVADRIRAFMDVKSPQGFLDKVKMLPMLAEMGKFFPKTVATGPCKEVIKRDNFSLLDFPILQCWPKDAGRFITLPCVISRDPKTGKRNVGMYRMQIYDERTTGMHWQRQKVGGRTLPRGPANRGPGRCGRERPRSCHCRGGHHGAYFRRVCIDRGATAPAAKWKSRWPSAPILLLLFPRSCPRRPTWRNI